MNIPRLDDIIDFVVQYRIDNNLPEPENSDELSDEWFINEYKKIMSKTKTKSKPIKEKKTYKEEKIMKASSELKKKGNKYTVDTEMNVKDGLDGKTKRALKKSITEEMNKKIKNSKKPVGFGVEKIVLDYSSSEDEKPKKRGRPKKGKGLESDSSSDEEDIKTYGQMLKHLVSHIKDPKEPIDPKDYKHAVMLIKKIKSKKGGAIRGCGDKEKIFTDKPYPKDFKGMRERARERNRIERNEEEQRAEKLSNKSDIQRQRLDLMKMRQEVSGLSDKAEKAIDDMLNIDKADLTKAGYQKMIKNLEEGMKDFYENKDDRMAIKPKLPDEMLVQMYEMGGAEDIPYHFIASAKRRIEEKEGETKPSGTGMKKRRGRPRKI